MSWLFLFQSFPEFFVCFMFRLQLIFPILFHVHLSIDYPTCFCPVVAVEIVINFIVVGLFIIIENQVVGSTTTKYLKFNVT